jgi:hypothetical protein
VAEQPWLFDRKQVRNVDSQHAIEDRFDDVVSQPILERPVFLFVETRIAAAIVIALQQPPARQLPLGGLPVERLEQLARPLGPVEERRA